MVRDFLSVPLDLLFCLLLQLGNPVSEPLSLTVIELVALLDFRLDHALYKLH